MKSAVKLLVCLGLVWGVNAQASTLSFSCITSNAVANCLIGQSQLSVDVVGTTKGVSFTFKNNVGSASSITDVYFDAGQSSLSGVPLPTITDSDGSGKAVAFSLNANPSNLPGGNAATPPFNASTSTAFTADSDAGAGGVMAHGVNAANEWLTMNYSLQTGKSLSDVLTELSNGKLRLGIHVQDFTTPSGGESFVNYPGLPPSSVPVPAAAWMLGSGLIGLVGVARRKVI